MQLSSATTAVRPTLRAAHVAVQEGRDAAPVLPAARPTCRTCPRRDACLAQGLADGDAGILDGLLVGQRRVRRGEFVVFEGQPSKYLYAVRSGSLKASVTTFEGREQVTGFAFPGDVVGFDALADGRHAATSAALEDSVVCAIPQDLLQWQAADARGALARQLHRKMGAALVRDRERALLLTRTNAESRVASFLLMVARRQGGDGVERAELDLSMSREEIGSYLGLALETVSRALSAFARRGWIAVDRRRVRLLRAGCLAEEDGYSRCDA